MRKQYELYCLTDRYFYDAPPVTRDTDYEISHDALPEGWEQVFGDEWTVYVPPNDRTPAQGWKVHVTGCAASAAEVLRQTWGFCVPRGIQFKHLRGPGTLRMRNAKYAPRGSSGKLVTIYPADEDQLECVLDGLGPLVAGLPGPYILSDLRIGDGPLHVRYGGFAERRCLDERGELVAAMEDGDGELVPDRRGPVFTVPSWTTLPRCLEPHLAARTATTTRDLPYRIERALHFSNGGGVYEAVDTRTGGKVVLKEARPHAGLAADDADAVTRLGRERDILTRLAGVEGVPAVHDYFTLGDHHFLVQEFIEGRALNTFFAERHPLLDPDPPHDKIPEYTEWALKIHAGVERVVGELHRRGVVFNDLHMFNVMVRPDDTVALIDFETAAPAGDNGRQTLASPAFLAPPDRRGAEVDVYSLACLRLALFLPMTTLFVLHRGKARQLADVIAEWFPVSPAFLDEAVAEITRTAPRTAAVPRPRPPGDGAAAGGAAPVFSPDPEGWTRVRGALGRAVLASATPERADRLFPGDVEQFFGSTLGLAHGAAGVLYALDATGVGRRPDHEEWLARRACDPPRGTGLGLYDGLQGAAYVLAGFGHVEAALDVADICLGERWEKLGNDLYGGLPGYALVLHHLADFTGESTLRAAAWRAADIVADRRAPGAGPPPRPGLMHGASGAALMFVRLYERGGDPALLDRAAEALREDLAGCVEDESGTQVKDGHRVLPYVDHGSVGIAMVLDDYLEHRSDEEFAAARAAIRPAATSHYYAQAGLFAGRAGMILHLARHDRAEPWVARHVRDLAWHALPYAGGLATPGDHLYRLSMDLATGTAGVLLAVGSALHDRPVGLPFLHRAPSYRPTGATVESSAVAPPRNPAWKGGE
ncbi:class III lanthionine synthetase LanKC [Actinomadura chibensis]|uniref:non-specific serine/threonine protein kinase n=1 Tax=Actinomadura chibensis TaxID=392828 RepID=A0A5D0NKV4_9ACTN|nr:class III lanthionine synthetase LanKC [Actinomadura chibensis]TYB44878.1 protein kinase/lanthionine synthetase C family protein [Actinomadura chibensis]